MVAVLAVGTALTGAVTANTAVADTFAAAHRGEALGPFGFGGVTLGMTAEQAKATRKVVRKFGGPGACSGWDLKAYPTGRDRVGVYISKRRGVAVIFAPKGVKTPEKIGLGSTRAKLVKAYPKLKKAASGSDDHLYTVVPGNPKAYYGFLLSHDKIYELSMELKTQDCIN